jgi:ElaB/YqjD/DUF883 family membrane-anchored ribosome-binding protein
MDRTTQDFAQGLGRLADDARALIAASADVAGDRVGEARKRLTRALENGEEIYHRARDRAIAEAKFTHAAIHQHPDPAIAVGVGVGALLGYWIAPNLTAMAGEPLWSNSTQRVQIGALGETNSFKGQAIVHRMAQLETRPQRLLIMSLVGPVRID